MRRSYFGALAVGAILVSACGGAAPSAATQPPATAAPAASAAPAAVDALYAAAKQEGAVIWQAGGLDQGAEKVAQAFAKKYPGIQVTFNPIKEPQVAAQVITEASAGSKVVKAIDVGHGSPTQFKPLLDRDLLLSADWKALGVDAERVLVDGKWVLNDDSVNVWMYNTSLVPAADVPKSWDDLLKPRWKGKIVVNTSASGLSQLFFTMGEDKTTALLTALRGQQLIVVASKGPARDMVVNGQAHIGISSVRELLDAKQRGAPVEGASALGPTERDVRGWYIPKGVQHPNAAKLFVAWMTSPEGRKLQSENGLELATPCDASGAAKYICDSGLKYVDPKVTGLDLFAYYEKGDAYSAKAAEILQLKPK
jgi:iron(III) transport system substrate-binding protein